MIVVASRSISPYLLGLSSEAQEENFEDKATARSFSDFNISLAQAMCRDVKVGYNHSILSMDDDWIRNCPIVLFVLFKKEWELSSRYPCAQSWKDYLGQAALCFEKL